MTRFVRARSVALLMALLCLVPVTQVAAWNARGHMEVAFVAYQKLTPAIRARVDALLALNPEFSVWKTLIPASVPMSDRPAMLFMIAATWPDRIKTQTGFHDDGTDNGNHPAGPTSSQNLGYTDKLHHKYWHFADRPFTRDGTALPAVPTPNAEERIHLFRQILASPTATDALKSYDLVWLEHLVGDVHEPLHDSTRVRKAQPAGDAGGNLVRVCVTQKCAATTERVALHAFWDDLLGTGPAVIPAVAGAKTLPAAATAAAAILNEGQWVQDGFALAQSAVYRAPIGQLGGPFSLTAAYRTRAHTLAETQVALAGARLANVLNAELK